MYDRGISSRSIRKSRHARAFAEWLAMPEPHRGQQPDREKGSSPPARKRPLPVTRPSRGKRRRLKLAADAARLALMTKLFPS